MEDSKGYTAKPKNPLYTTGVYVRTVQADYSKAAADESGTKIKLARNLPLSAQVVGLRLPHGAKASVGLDDVNIGICKSDTASTALDIDALVDGIGFDSVITSGADILGTNIAAFPFTSNIGDLLSLGSDQAYAGGVDIVAEIVAAGTAAFELQLEVLLAFPA